MVLVDTSVWVDLFRDPNGHVRDALQHVTRDDDTVLTRFNQLELLQGARDEHEWSMLADRVVQPARMILLSGESERGLANPSRATGGTPIRTIRTWRTTALVRASPARTLTLALAACAGGGNDQTGPGDGMIGEGEEKNRRARTARLNVVGCE